MTNLKLLRISYGLTQVELERGSGVARWKISLAENARFALTEAEASAVAGVFSVPAESLLAKPHVARLLGNTNSGKQD